MTRREEIWAVVKQWIDKAEKDLLTAEREITFDDPITESVCFHCQQAVEKFLKAYLVAQQKPFSKTHNISHLLELCSTIDKSFSDLEKADDLTDYAVQVRYPDTWFEPNVMDAKQAIEMAKQVKDFVLHKLDVRR